MLVELAQQIGIDPKKVSVSRGGIFHSPCPYCGGKDRFTILEKEGWYWCRQCKKGGDAIQFCRDFLGISFYDALRRVGRESETNWCSPFRSSVQSGFVPVKTEKPLSVWQSQARPFVSKCHQRMLADSNSLKKLLDRGFDRSSLERYQLGWNQDNQLDRRPDWGVELEFKANGKEKMLWLPRGIVIPYLNGNEVIKIKIRRADWHPDDEWPKYIEVTGSMKTPSIFGDEGSNFGILVESELDAMLIQQVAGDLCYSIAIGGCGKKPDQQAHRFLGNLSGILFSLDFDEAGKKVYEFWRSTYPKLRPWIVPRGKSPGDALKLGVDLREWIIDGLKDVFQQEVRDGRKRTR